MGPPRSFIPSDSITPLPPPYIPRLPPIRNRCHDTQQLTPPQSPIEPSDSAPPAEVFIEKLRSIDRAAKLKLAAKATESAAGDHPVAADDSSSNPAASKFCTLHKTHGHDTSECEVHKEQERSILAAKRQSLYTANRLTATAPHPKPAELVVPYSLSSLPYDPFEKTQRSFRRPVIPVPEMPAPPPRSTTTKITRLPRTRRPPSPEAGPGSDPDDDGVIHLGRLRAQKKPALSLTKTDAVSPSSRKASLSPPRLVTQTSPEGPTASIEADTPPASPSTHSDTHTPQPQTDDDSPNYFCYISPLREYDSDGLSIDD